MLSNVIYRELKLLRGRKRFMWSMILLPILSFVFLLTLFGGGELHDMPIAVVDYDKSAMSRRFTRMLDAAAGVQVDYEAGSIREAEELLKRNEVYAIVTIPHNMQNDIYSTTTVEPQLFINTSRILNASLVYKDVAMVAQMLSTGIEIQLLESKGKTPDQAMTLALPIYYEKHILFNPYTSYPYYLVSPFNMIMTLIFVVLATLYTLGMERKERTAEQWLKSAGGSPYVAVIGKLLPYSLYFGLWLSISSFVMAGVFEYPFNGSVVILTLLNLVVMVSYQALALLLLLILKNLMESMSVTAAIATMSFTMGGLTFPQMAMAKPIYYIAQLFPYTHYLEGFVDVMRGASWYACLPYLAILLIYWLIAILVIPALCKLLLSEEKERLGIE